MKTERLEIKLSKELKDKIKQEAKKLEISMSDYIRMKLNS